MADYLIQNAHNGRNEFVLVIDGRCGTVTRPASFEETRETKRILEAEGRDADRWESRNPSIYR